jgi:hypothetical protein
LCPPLPFPGKGRTFKYVSSETGRVYVFLFCYDVFSAIHFHQNAVQLVYTNSWYKSSDAECPFLMIARYTGTRNTMAARVIINPIALAGIYIQPIFLNQVLFMVIVFKFLDKS